MYWWDLPITIILPNNKPPILLFQPLHDSLNACFIQFRAPLRYPSADNTVHKQVVKEDLPSIIPFGLF